MRELDEYGLSVQIHDPCADPKEALREFGVEIRRREALRPANAVILAVAHHRFVVDGWSGITSLLRGEQGIVIDVKGVLDRSSRPRDVDLRRL